MATPSSSPGVSIPIAKDTSSFDKFLTIKHGNAQTKLRKSNPFVIDKALKDIIGNKFWYQVKPLSSGHLLIEVDQKQAHDKLLTVTKLHDIPVKVEAHNQLNQTKGKVYCDAICDLSSDKIKSQLADQHVTEVYQVKDREDKLLPIYILTFRQTSLPQSVKIGYINCRIQPYIPRPRQCFNCQGYGHGKNTCRQDPICAKCAISETDHPDYEACQNDPKCCHCAGNHSATSRECPMYKLEKKISERKVKHNMTYPTARDEIYHSHPELVSQVPKLKLRRNKNTYSAAVSSPSPSQIQIQQPPQQSTQQQNSLINDLHQIILQQQEQINKMQQQLHLLMQFLMGSNKINVNTNGNVSNVDTSKRHKRSLSETNLSPTTTKPPKMRDTSSRQEVINSSATVLHQSMEASPSLGAVGGAMDLTVLTPPSHVPPAPPDQVVKEGVKAGSSDPQKDQKGDVSKKKNSGNRPCPKSFKDVKSKTDSGRK